VNLVVELAIVNNKLTILWAVDFPKLINEYMMQDKTWRAALAQPTMCAVRGEEELIRLKKATLIPNPHTAAVHPPVRRETSSYPSIRGDTRLWAGVP